MKSGQEISKTPSSSKVDHFILIVSVQMHERCDGTQEISGDDGASRRISYSGLGRLVNIQPDRQGVGFESTIPMFSSEFLIWLWQSSCVAFQKVVRYCSAVVLICGGACVSDMSKGGVSLGIAMHACLSKSTVIPGLVTWPGDHLSVVLTKWDKASRTLSQGSVDIYAAQCKNCLKWREIDTQEEFEEIRSKVTEEPFLCSRKANSSCDEPGDIEYDSTRTWVIDKPNLPKTPQGFKRSLVLRKDYSKLDAYYITPAGKKLRTRNEIAAFLKDNPEFKGVSASDFDFSSPKIMQDTIPEIIEQKDSANKKVKIAKDEV
ncbi:Methyl-CpG-binding domain-containing protein 4 [Glycine max]|nr:Methyl-CpG-binding domain-containing protein 4 [Glycine max]